jgi:hypothetical protein
VKIPKVGEPFVCRVVDSLDTDPIRAELQEFGRAHFIENWDVQRNCGCKCISVPLITFIDGFGLYRNSYRSLMGFYQTPAALSFSDRNRRANVLPITLGPHSSNFDDVVGALKQFKLLDKGVAVDINGEPTYMCVVLHRRYVSTAGELWIQNPTWNARLSILFYR